MEKAPSREFLATTHPRFVGAIRNTLTEGRDLIFLKRLNRCGGAKQAFHVRSVQDLEIILRLAKPGDAFSVFFPPMFPLRGRAGEAFARQAADYARSQGTMGDWVAAVVLGRGAETTEFEYVSSPDEIRVWFDEHPSAEMAIGVMDFTKPDCDNVLTAYVPDPDGVVRPGAY